MIARKYSGNYVNVRYRKKSGIKQYVINIADAFERAYDNAEENITFAICKLGRKFENDRIFRTLEKTGILTLAVSVTVLILLILFLGF